jgi:hypothetical protein
MDNRKLSDQNYRKDHEHFGEVQEITYQKGEIVEFGVKETDPFTLDDTAKVKLSSGGETGFLPIFYHCEEGFYTEGCAELSDNESLKHGALAFGPDMEAMVMFKGMNPVAIIGHTDHPRRCLDILKFDLYGYVGVFTTEKSSVMRYHFRVSDQSLLCDMNENCVDSAGKDYGCTKKATHICGLREVQFGTVVYYMGDWLIELGPIFYIFQTYAIGMPGPMTGQIWMSAAPASSELRDKTIAAGKDKELIIPTRLFSPIPPMEFYPEFTIQTKFSKVLFDKWGGYVANTPRWIYSELYAQEHLT